MTNDNLIIDYDTRFNVISTTNLTKLDIADLIKSMAMINNKHFTIDECSISSDNLEYVNLLLDSLLFIKSKSKTNDILIYTSLVTEVSINVIYYNNRYNIVLDNLIDF